MGKTAGLGVTHFQFYPDRPTVKEALFF